MSTLNLYMNGRLARTVAYTERLKTRPRMVKPLRMLAQTADFIARGVFYLWRNQNYLTCVKVANMALVNLQFWFKTEKVWGRPYNMKIESTNICNTHCQLCPTGLGLEGRAKGKMSLDQFKTLIDQLKQTLFGLDLSMWGDPLIVPDIYKMIRHAHDRGIWTYISSNLHAFKPDKDQAEQLVRSGLDLMTCSLHGASQETYERYQPGKNFDEAVDKIRHILQTRERLQSSTPQVQLNFVVTRHNEHEREAFAQLAHDLGCKAVFSTASLNIRFQDKDQKLQPLGLAPDLLEKKIKTHIKQWLPKDKAYALEPYQEILAGKSIRGDQFNGHKTMNCSWPWRSSVINWDGDVSTCCGSFEQVDDMGNVLKQPFGQVWNGPKYQAARRSFKKKVSGQQAQGNPCAECPGYML